MANKYLDYNGVAYLWQKIKNALLTKVDKVDGKGLSTNDYTAAEKTKLAGIAAGAEVNVNADWSASTGDAAILNKPSIPSKTSDLTNDSDYVSDASYVHTDNNYTSTEKTKLSGIAAGAEVNVQSDWNITSTTSDAYIKNKPSIPSASGTTPSMDGTAAVGTSAAYARADHVHPSDTSKVDCSKTESNSHASSISYVDGIVLRSMNPSDTGWWSMIDVSPLSLMIATSGLQGGTADITLADDSIRLTAAGSTAILADSSGTYIHNVVTPSSSTDAANKAYVDGKTVVDSAMSSSSTNPVQNSVVKAYIDNAIGGITGIDFQVVASLPSTGTKGIIYLVSNSGSGTNSYDEYIWVSNAWEKIGTTDVDLSGYMLKTDMVAITNAEIDTIVAA